MEKAQKCPQLLLHIAATTCYNFNHILQKSVQKLQDTQNWAILHLFTEARPVYIWFVWNILECFMFFLFFFVMCYIMFHFIEAYPVYIWNMWNILECFYVLIFVMFYIIVHFMEA